MNVVIDMIDAIAAIALALRAVAELEVRVFRIRSAAHKALVAVGALPGAVLIILRPVGVRLLLRRGGTAEFGAALALGTGGMPAQRQRQELRQLMPAEEQAGQLRHDRQEV